jgi:predicted ATPase
MVLEVCLEGKSGVLFLDDLHWADEATLDFLTYVVRRLAGSPVFILVTWHTADVPPGHRLRDLLSDSQRSGYATSLNLERLKASDLAVMVEEASKNGLNNPPGLAERLYVETEDWQPLVRLNGKFSQPRRRSVVLSVCRYCVTPADAVSWRRYQDWRH